MSEESYFFRLSDYDDALQRAYVDGERWQLGIEVDVTTRDSLHPMLRKEIERTAVRVF